MEHRRPRGPNDHQQRDVRPARRGRRCRDPWPAAAAGKGWRNISCSNPASRRWPAPNASRRSSASSAGKLEPHDLPAPEPDQSQRRLVAAMVRRQRCSADEVDPSARRDPPRKPGQRRPCGNGRAGLRAADAVVVERDVAAGRLCVLFPDRISVRGWSYWLAYPRERRMVPKVKRFREWLLAEMRQALEEYDGGWEMQGRITAAPQG